MTIPTISTLPTAPARTDAPATFISRADAFLAALVTMQTELNTSIGAMNTDIAGVNADATAAAASATAAANASNASAWVSGTTYALGDVVYSPVDYQSYRRIIAGAGATDPSSDATNWTKISAEPLPTQTGNAGEFLTTDGTNASWSPLSTSPSIDAVASGALGNGDTVVINSDGTVSAISGSDAEVGSAVVFNTATTTHIASCYDSNANKVVVFYNDSATAGDSFCRVGTVSGSSITFGSAVFFDGNAAEMSAVFDSNANKVVVFYRDGDNSSWGTGMVGTVSGTSISFGSPVVMQAGATYDISACFDSSANKIVIAFRDQSSSYYGICRLATVSGTSLTFTSSFTFNSQNTYSISCSYDVNSNKTAIFYTNSSGGQGRAIIGTVSGSSISFNSATNFASSNTQYISSDYDSSQNKMIVAYKDANDSNYGKALISTISGSSFSFSSSFTFESAESEYISVSYNPEVNKTNIFYKDGGNSNYGTLVTATVSGDTLSFTDPLVFETGYVLHVSSSYIPGQNSTAIFYRDAGNSSYGTATCYVNLSTNITDSNYIGISDGAYSDAETAKIQIVGSVDDAQSGLTAGSSYYVQTNGSLATTASDPSVFAGTAISATKLIIKG